MAVLGQSQTVTFRDSKRYTTSVRFYVRNSGALTVAQLEVNASNIVVDMAALSNAALQSAQGPYTTAATAVVQGAQATYESAEDKLALTFSTAAGALHTYQIPAPAAAFFLNDGETVDTGNASVRQLIADMLDATYMTVTPTTGQTAGAGSRSGEALTVFIGGIRKRRKNQRKQSIFSLSPTGGEGE